MSPSDPSVSLTGATADRLEELLRTAAEWSAELGIPGIASSAADHARSILALIEESVRDASLRVFPNEDAGVSIQMRGETVTKVLDIGADELAGTIHDRSHHRHVYYTLNDDRAAAAFIAA